MQPRNRCLRRLRPRAGRCRRAGLQCNPHMQPMPRRWRAFRHCTRLFLFPAADMCPSVVPPKCQALSTSWVVPRYRLHGQCHDSTIGPHQPNILGGGCPHFPAWVRLLIDPYPFQRPKAWPSGSNLTTQCCTRRVSVVWWSVWHQPFHSKCACASTICSSSLWMGRSAGKCEEHRIGMPSIL